MSPEVRAESLSPRVLVVSGSPRACGNSEALAERIASEIESASVTTEVVRLRELDYSSCVGCELCRKSGICTRFDDGMTTLYDKIRDARGLVLISPVHNYNVSAWMKSFIDRLYCFYEFDYPRPGPWRSVLAGQDRKAVVVAVAEQLETRDAGFTLEAMRRPLEALGYEVVDEVLILGTFEKGSVSQLSEAMLGIEAAAGTLTQALVRSSGVSGSIRTGL
ncbi:MAG: flavodoxin family protein [Coriobacteriia bacterium]|nr:flavodoxin family protein [Coriobacteriia bacterium]